MVDLLPLPVLTSAQDGGFPSRDDRWALVERFIRDKGLANHQIKSFNDFLDKKLPKIVEEFKGG
jgi:DNA-directed RNA polymerase, subunit B" (EC 2.7.7.6)/DNA-directed RNA polymerase, subunit B' (EC 2.7.7.6)